MYGEVRSPVRHMSQVISSESKRNCDLICQAKFLLRRSKKKYTIVRPTEIRNTRKSPSGKVSNVRPNGPLDQYQLVTSSKNVATKRPMINVWILCICKELAAASFSSKLIIDRNGV